LTYKLWAEVIAGSANEHSTVAAIVAAPYSRLDMRARQYAYDCPSPLDAIIHPP
jgi:hypothetical protein